MFEFDGEIKKRYRHCLIQLHSDKTKFDICNKNRNSRTTTARTDNGCCTKRRMEL